MQEQIPDGCDLCPNKRRHTPWANYCVALAIASTLGAHFFVIHDHDKPTPWIPYGSAIGLVLMLLPVRLDSESLRDGVELLEEIKGLIAK